MLSRFLGLRQAPQALSGSSLIRSMSGGVFGGASKDASIKDFRGATIDESEQASVNIDALSMAQSEAGADKAKFQYIPDDRVLEQEFNNVKYKDLPYVTVCCGRNNTRMWANDKTGKMLFYTSPLYNGFKNAAKRTNVAAQVTGMKMGQLLRGHNIRQVKVRVDGFNLGRIASIEGLVQSGIDVVSISDVTTVLWHYPQRPKKRKRQN